jgi:hypothetical protein
MPVIVVVVVHDCVMLELVLVAIVLGEPAVELWARLRALA